MNDFYGRAWSMPEKMMLTTTALFFGMFIGFLFSPLKKGIYCNNHNGETHLYGED